MDVSPAKRSYFTCANVWWKLLFHSTPPKALEKIIIYLYSFYTQNRKRDASNILISLFLYKYYFNFAPSLNAVPTLSPIA